MSLHDQRKKLAGINQGITALEGILDCISTAGDQASKMSDFGWFSSILAGELGVLLAVRAGVEGRAWQDIARKLEETILLLKIDQRILECEIERRDLLESQGVSELSSAF